MSTAGIAVPGTVVPVGAQASPGGAQGIGTSSWTYTTANFTVPPVGQTVVVSVQDTSWVAVGETVWVATAGGDPNTPAPLLVQAKTATSLTLLNPVTSTSPGISTDAGNQAKLGSDHLIYVPYTSVTQGFVAKTAAYTLTSADSGKYFICSGGSWTLTLPVPAAGMLFQVRNDMGIVFGSTTGTITLQPNTGTIDGKTSIALLPQQECTLLTDGTNWRTIGLKREVILGTLDITAAVASATILLPVGYRLFVLDLAVIISSAPDINLELLFSSDGGNTFPASGYYYEFLYNTATTTAGAANGSGATVGFVGNATANALGGSMQIKIYPGSSTTYASWLSQTQCYSVTNSFEQHFVAGGSYGSPSYAVQNAVKFLPSSGTINNMFLTVKGVV